MKTVTHALRPLAITIVALCSFATSPTAHAGQGQTSSRTRKGRLYLSWGYNRSAYTASDIRFTGPKYDFTLHGITAKDRPTEFSFDTYLNPTRATIPQYEFRISYFISDKTNLSFGISHLKYVATQNQGTNISGFIDPSLSIGLGGNHDFDPIALASSFVRFEHTNGLNYESVEIETLVPLRESQSKTTGLYLTTAAGFGIIIPKSDVTLFNDRNKNVLHLAGYGINGKLGLRFEFLDRFFVKGFANFGYINLSSILTRSGDTGDRASQSFYFIEGSMIVGASVYTF